MSIALKVLDCAVKRPKCVTDAFSRQSAISLTDSALADV